MGKWKKDKRLDCFKYMPPRVHRIALDQSEVIKWIAESPELLSYLFDVARGRTGREPLVEYNAEADCWYGVVLSECNDRLHDITESEVLHRDRYKEIDYV